MRINRSIITNFQQELDWGFVTGRPTTLSGYGITDAVPSSRTLTINGTSYDLTANRSWTVTAAGVSGTTNYIPKFATSTTLGDSLIYDSGTYIGIGTTSPATRLQIIGGNTAEGQLYVGNTDVEYTAGINFYTSTTNRGFVGWRHTNSGSPFTLTGIHLFNTDNSNIVFGTNNTVRAVISTSGNVLVGTTTDSGEKLQVNGDIKTASPSGGTAKAWKLGNASSATGDVQNTKIEVEVDGVLYYLIAYAV